MIQNLNITHWQHTKKKAELILDSKTLIEMEFSRKVTVVKMGKQKFEITKDGF